MKETLRRELNKTYLVLSSEEPVEETYELTMIVKNVPEKILPLQVLRVDGKMQLLYDVSSKQSLKALAGKKGISGSMIRRLFEGLESLVRETREYLLDMECVLLDPEYIYIKEEGVYFCYYPWERTDTVTAFRKMLEEILGIMDYHDTKGVELAYHLYQSACRGDFSIGEILREHEEKEELPLPGDLPVLEKRCIEPEVKKEIGKGKEKKKKGIWQKILYFFLTKEAAEQKMKEEEAPGIEAGYEFHRELEIYGEDPVKNSDTMLLGRMPAGTFQLRPQMEGYEKFEITEENFLIGKKKEAVDGYINRDTVSRIHCRLSLREERLFIADSNSTNGTFVNGRPVNPGEEVEIFAGDRILFADVEYECYNSL